MMGLFDVFKGRSETVEADKANIAFTLQQSLVSGNYGTVQGIYNTSTNKLELGDTTITPPSAGLSPAVPPANQLEHGGAAMTGPTALPPIYISVAGPSGVGKTTIIATIMRDTTKALPAPFKVSPAARADQARIADFNRELQAAISSGDFTRNAQAMTGTQGIAMYNYRIEYKDIIHQPFSIMDVPGGWLRTENRPPDQWEQYEEHLQKSTALWVPVESPLLMEAKTPQEKRKMARFLMTTDVRDVVEQWAKYRETEEHCNEPAVLCIAPMKCETYFSKAVSQEIPENFFDAFTRQYAEIVETAKEHCPHCEIFYAPVESIGCVQLEKMDWYLTSDNAPPAISYEVLAPYHQEIAGVEGLTSSVYRYGAQRIRADIQAQRRSVFQSHNAVLKAHNVKQEEYNNRNVFTKFFDTFGGSQAKKAEITQLQQEVKRKVEELNRLSKELNLLSDVLIGLANRSDQSPYFRKLYGNDAIADYTQAIKLAPNNAEAYHNRGFAYAEIGDYDEAIADYTRAIKLAPNNALYQNNRGFIYSEIGDCDNAIADYTRAINIEPNNADTYNNRGNAYSEIGDYFNAFMDYTQAIALDPNNADAYNWLGNIFSEKGVYDSAIENFTQSVKLAPNNAEAYYNRGIAYARKGDWDKAIEDYTQVIKLDPNDAIVYNDRGFAYARKGDWHNAIEDYTQAIKLDPNDAIVYNNRGLAYYRKGDYDKAIMDYTHAIRLDPNNVQYQDNLKAAKRRGK
jgi:tetratricopeptide (TPR) repeat protein